LPCASHDGIDCLGKAARLADDVLEQAENRVSLLVRIRSLINRSVEISSRLEMIQRALGRIELRQLADRPVRSLEEQEFQVFSQWGEDGIIQALLRKVPVPNRTFVEFGVQNYVESNTRFLLKNDNWSGLVIDGSEEHIRYIKNDPIYWMHNLKAECAFIDRDNINGIIATNGIRGDIGILSIDIDGNDYWVWKAIDVVRPRIVICEYNSRFGPSAKVTIPYHPTFERSKAHHSNLYWGASIAALAALGADKGYALVGSNTAGNNVFFVREDVRGDVTVLSPREAFRKAQFRDSRDRDGELSFLGWEAGFGDAATLSVFELDSQSLVQIRTLDLGTGS
jgi:hypothetical protein